MKKLPVVLEGLEKSQLESMCVDCGLCCYASVPVAKSTGNVLIPDLRCKHLEIEKATGKSCCSVYEQRHDVAKGWCLPLTEAIAKGVFPDACPYVRDVQGYVGTAILPDSAYDAIRPQLVKALAAQGKPPWVSDSTWDQFLTTPS